MERHRHAVSQSAKRTTLRENAGGRDRRGMWRGENKPVALLATLALACPLIVASPQPDKRGQQRREERREERNDRRNQGQNNQGQNQDNNQSAQPQNQQNFAPRVPGSNVPARPLTGPGPH